MQFNQKNKTLILITGICLISAVVIGYRLIKREGLTSIFPKKEIHGPYLTIGELPLITSTSTDQIQKLLETAFNENKLAVSSTYQIERTKDRLVFAGPSYSSSSNDMSGCGLSDNPYCGLYIVTSSSSRLVAFGPKLFGFSKVERFIDSTHAQFLTNWTMYNFTSIDRKQLNLENGEILPLLVTETDQDDQSASLNVSGYGDVLTLLVSGDSIRSRLAPVSIVLQNQEKQTVFTVATPDLIAIQDAFVKDTDRKLKTIQVISSDQDVISKTLRVDLYSIPFKLDLSKNTLERIK